MATGKPSSPCEWPTGARNKLASLHDAERFVKPFCSHKRFSVDGGMARYAQQFVHHAGADALPTALGMDQDFRDPRHDNVIGKGPSVSL